MPSSDSNLFIQDSIVGSAAERVVERCGLLATFTDQPGEVTRVFCSPAMKMAHETISGWMQAADMNCELDAVGNLIGKFGSHENERPIFVIGSHLDTVINAGRFDGTLGALLGLAVVEVIREANMELNFDVHVVGFSEEEGVRYSFPFIGSLGIVGQLDSTALSCVDADQVSMKDALAQFGCDVDQINSASYQDRPVVGFMEAHIEQADLLQESDVSVGVVSAIAGQTRATIKLLGQAGHAGTLLHDRRRDALAGAAELILKIESIGQQTPGLFATVGKVDAQPGLSNVISGQTELRLDLRHESDEIRKSAFDKIKSSIKSIADSRNLEAHIESAHHTPATPMNDDLTEQVNLAVGDAGLPAKSMVSGAGHDAMIMARIAPSCMLFVRCRDGISHHPDEYVSPEDIFAVLKVMVQSLIRISNQHSTDKS
jgi:allantoate deiminase